MAGAAGDRCSSASRSWPSTSASLPIDQPEADRHRPGRRRRVYGDGIIGFYLFQAFTALLLFLAANTSLRRVPAPRRDPGRGRLHAAPVRVPRRPPGVLARASSCSASSPRSLVVAFGGETHAADPALRGRRVHRLHDQPGRHDPALAARPRSPAGAGGWRSTRSAASLTGVVVVVVTSRRRRRRCSCSSSSRSSSR